jgi:cyclopropane-fatty-acyl-phospholipid synthase
MTTAQTLTSPVASIPIQARVMLSLLERIRFGSIRLVTPGKCELMFGDPKSPDIGELHIHDWKACSRILSGGDIGLAEAYRDGQIDSPDLTALLRLVLRNEAELLPALFGNRLISFWNRIKHCLRHNSRRGSRRNIHAHYDIGNDFYRLWLDASWTYSSAWYAGDFTQSLEQAQAAKYQRICETLRLKHGQQVLEIGCGWGGFAEHASRLGVAVHGVTISPSQLRYARIRLADHPLIKLDLCDYRDVSGVYDAIVSIEMFEAVGERYWSSYFDTLKRCLRLGGQALVQTITIDEAHFERYRSGSDFIQQFIFPGGMLPSVPRFIALAAQHGFKIVNQLHFGPDYAETLRQWRTRFEANLENLRLQGFDDAFMRIWRLYLCYCEAGFDEGRIGVSQLLLVRNR